MEMRALGTTRLTVSRIGIGLAALGRPGYINLGHAHDLDGEYDVAIMEARTHHVLDVAWEQGVRYFDTARSYGRGEQFLGGWLRAKQMPDASVTVGSKWGYTYTADWQVDAEAHEIKDHSLPVLQRQWQETQAQLGDYVKLYQIHSATFESGVLENREVLAELARLKQHGVAIGISVSGLDQAAVIRQAITITVDGVRLFDCVQATWNLLEQAAGTALQEAHDAGLGTIVKEAVANGRLTGRNTDPSFADKLRVLHHEANRLSTTIDALATAGVLAQPWVDVVLSGAATEEHLRSNLTATHVQWDDEATDALSSIAEDSNTYWSIRKALPWN